MLCKSWASKKMLTNQSTIKKTVPSGAASLQTNPYYNFF